MGMTAPFPFLLTRRGPLSFPSRAGGSEGQGRARGRRCASPDPFPPRLSRGGSPVGSSLPPALGFVSDAGVWAGGGELGKLSLGPCPVTAFRGRVGGRQPPAWQALVSVRPLHARRRVGGKSQVWAWGRGGRATLPRRLRQPFRGFWGRHSTLLNSEVVAFAGLGCSPRQQQA